MHDYSVAATTLLSRRSVVREYLHGAYWCCRRSASSFYPRRRVEMFQGTAGDARGVLIVVSATMITTTGIVFSLTVLSLQIASSQFSVRLLRTFLRDVPNQVVHSIRSTRSWKVSSAAHSRWWTVVFPDPDPRSGPARAGEPPPEPSRCWHRSLLPETRRPRRPGSSSSGTLRATSWCSIGDYSRPAAAWAGVQWRRGPLTTPPISPMCCKPHSFAAAGTRVQRTLQQDIRFGLRQMGT